MSGPPPTARLPTFLEAFEAPGFIWVWLSVLAANSGRFCVILVAGYEAFVVGRSAFWSGSIAMVLMFPMIVVTPLAGGIADRFNRPLVMAAGMALATLASVAAALGSFGAVSLPLLIALTLLIGVGAAIQFPAWQAMIPGLVGPRRLLGGSLLAQIAQQGAELTGPAIGTAVLALGGPVAGFSLCAAFYLLGAIFAWHVRHLVATPEGGPVERGVLGPVLRGLAYLFRHPQLRLLAAFVTLHCALTMAFLGILPSLASAHLGGGGGTYGAILTSVGLGAIGGPLLLMIAGRRLRDVYVLFGSGFLSGAALAALGLVPTLPAAIAAGVAVGAGDAVFMALAYTLAQRMTGEHMRARISSSQIVITAGSMSLLSMGWGALVDPWGPALALIVPGAAFVVVVAGFLRTFRIFDVGPARPTSAAEIQTDSAL